MPRAPLVLSLLALTLLGPLLAQETDADVDRALGREGSLRNTTPLPSDPNAAAALRRGDEAWARVRAGAGAAARSEAFDAWAAALAQSPIGAAVQASDPGAPRGLWPDPDGTLERRAEGVPAAVRRRLAALDDGERRTWTSRTGTAARAALAAAGRRADALARVERDFPATDAAALAALRCADLAVERGARASAGVWLDRAEAHGAAPGVAVPEGWGRALATRRRWAEPQMAAAPARAPTVLVPLQTLRLEGRRAAALAGLGRDVQPGLVPLADGSLAVQTPRTLVLLDPRSARGEAGATIRRESLEQVLGPAGGPAARPPVTSPSAGGWALRPATDGTRIALVAGRGQPGRRFRDLPLPARGNVLAVLSRDARGELVARWTLGDLGLLAGDAPAPAPGSPLLGPGGAPWAQGWEFQPGPVIADGALFVLARRLADPTVAEDGPDGDSVLPDTLRLFALDLGSGALRWSRDLTRAADLGAEERRGAPGLGIATSGAPLAVVDGRVLVQTNVGLLASCAVPDGRLEWAFRNQRRGAEGGGWPGSRAPRPLPGGGAAWFAPFDSDFAYLLPARAPDGGPLLWAPPLPRGDAYDLAALAPDGAPLVVTRAGRFTALEVREPAGGARPLAYLGEAERVTGLPATFGDLLAVASDRHLRLLDLARGGRLEAAAPLEDAQGAPRGGDVVLAPGAAPAVAWVVGLDALWIFGLR